MYKNRNLNSKQLEALWTEYIRCKDQNVFQQLIEYYYPYVQEIATKVAEKFNWRYQPDELASFGIDGLYTAIPRFNLEYGVKFESFAAQRIRGAIIDGLRREDEVPRNVRLASEQFEKHKQRIQNHVGHHISDAEFVSMIGMDETEYHKNHRKYVATNSISLDSHEDNDVNIDDIKSDSNQNLIDNSISSADAKICRKDFFSKLMSGCSSQTERKIIYLYYYKSLTMDKVAAAVKLSESRVSQIHKKVIKRLKKKIERNPAFFDRSVIQYIVECNHQQCIFS